MKLNKAYKFRIYPNENQKIMFAKTFGSVRFIYNKMLADKIDHYEKSGEMLKNTPAGYKNAYPWLREVDSLALSNAQLNLQTAFKRFFDSKSSGHPVFKSKRRSRQSYTTNNQRCSIRIVDEKIKLPKVGFVKIKHHREIPDGYAIKSATVSMTPTFKYYVSLLTEYEDEIVPVDIKNVVGIDFSMKELYVTSDEEFANYPRYYRNAQAKLAREQRRLSGCVKGGNNYRKQRIKIARLHEKIANQRKDFLHKKSRAIASSYDAVCIEDLDMKAMSRALNFGKSVSDNGFGMFRSFLEYKLSEQGKKLIKISKWFPSSKTCSRCGTVKEELDLSARTYICECGFICDRDVNAAINIKAEAMRMLGMRYEHPRQQVMPMFVREKELQYVV